MVSLDSLGKYREHGMLFGGGVLAGLLLFLVWLSLQPSRKVEAPVDAAAKAAETRGPARQPDGVLGDIAGEFQPGGRAVVEDVPAPGDDEPPPVESEADGVDPGAEAPVSDEEAIAGALLSPEGGEGTPPLRTWYVEVARGPGVSEVLEISAPSPEQALIVLRDFRGDPRVLRGPSTQPFP